MVTSAIRPLIIRDSREAIDQRYDEITSASRQTQRDDRFGVTGDVDAVSRRLLEYWSVGVSGFIVQMKSPFDRITLERLLREVRPRLASLIAAQTVPVGDTPLSSSSEREPMNPDR
jgi:hypothetical protein